MLASHAGSPGLGPQDHMNWVQCRRVPVILALGRRQQDLKFKTVLGYIVSSRLV